MKDDDVFQRILYNNPMLLFLYLEHTSHAPETRFAFSSIVNFLFWFATEGRRQFPQIAIFDRSFVDLFNVEMNGSSHVGDKNADAPRVGWRDIQSRAPAGFFAANGSRRPGRSSTGVSIVGFHRYAMGLGEDARRLFAVLRHIDRPVDLVDIGNDALEKAPESKELFLFESERPSFPILIFCAPIFEIARVLTLWGQGALQGRYVIAAAPWELTAFPPYWETVFQFINEIWASSEFLMQVYQKAVSRPVHHIPLHVSIAEPRGHVKSRIGIPEDKFSFISFMDFNSTMKRKNAKGSVAAFRQAFRAERDVILIIKTVNVDVNSPNWRSLLAAIDGDERVFIVDGALDRQDVSGLVATSDVFLSLHRSEGFGRVLAEAMLLGSLVIATDWSGSRDIVTCETGLLVRCELRPVQLGDYPEAAGEWAEPDQAHAAELMQIAYRRYDMFDEMRYKATKLTGEKYSLSAIAEIVAKRLIAIDTVL